MIVDGNQVYVDWKNDDYYALAIDGTLAIIGLGAEYRAGREALEVALRQANVTPVVSRLAADTGGRTFPKWKWGANNINQAEVDEAYTVIANSKTDVDAIARYLNLNDRSRVRLDNIKDYLFKRNNGIPNFEADPAIATAWQRLRTGAGTDSDKLLLKHEVAEIWLKKNNPGISHTEAHRLANARANWEDTIPWLDFD